MFGEKGVNHTLDADGNVSAAGLPDPDKSYAEAANVPVLQLRNLASVNSDWELLPRYVPHKTINGRTIKPLDIWRYFTKQPWTEATAALLIEPPANKADFERCHREPREVRPGPAGPHPRFLEELPGGPGQAGSQGPGKKAKTQLVEAGLLK
ncbi:MAG: hypothetical protein MZV49_14195 [Rhodopseudomonas palustris]|nr:hypothetical protein [Rhodopseudomonas palustris]